MSAPLTSPMLPDTSASDQSRMELQARLAGLGGLGGRKLDPEAKAKKLREACEGFESIFIQKMWQEMRKTVHKSGLLTGREEKFWQDMYDHELSKSMTTAGGIGLADMMYQQLSRNLASASSVSANAATGSSFTPTAAPLVTPVEDAGQERTTPVNSMTGSVKPMAAIYDGVAPESTVPLGEEESQPVMAQAARKQNLRHADTFTRQPGSRESAHAVSNGLNQAYLAHREAGDKLSANAVRPALRPQKRQARQQAAERENMQSQVAAQPAHGSAQSLSAALETAKSGMGIQPQSQPRSLQEIVNDARARNSLRAALNARSQTAEPQPAAAVQNAQPAENQPVVRKTRYITNIPSNAKNKKNDGIRMLNVDNVGVNSKQGQGLAEWHARQAGMDQSNNMATGRTHPGGQTLEAPAAPISPLTAQDAAGSHDLGNFAIPPLRAMDIKG